MSKYFASTTVSIDVKESDENYLNVDSLTSADPEESLVEVTCNDLNGVHFETYQCKIIKNEKETLDVTEDITLTSASSGLQHHPANVKKVEFLLNPDNFSINDIKIVGDTIYLKNYTDGKFCILRISYIYDCKHLTLKYSSSGETRYSQSGTGKTEVQGVLKSTYEDLNVVTALTFTYKFPDLTVEQATIDGKQGLKIYSTANDRNITYTITGASVAGSLTASETQEESITFSGGIGYATKGVSSINSVEFLQNHGLIRKDTSLYTANKLLFTPSSSGFGGSNPASKEAVAKVSYETLCLSLTFKNITGDISYTVRDSWDNSVVGIISSSSDDSKDVAIKVYDYLTGFPISGAKVEISGQTATTDTAGVATFTGLKSGKYKVVVTKSGYFSNLNDNLVNEYIDV